MFLAKKKKGRLALENLAKFKNKSNFYRRECQLMMLILRLMKNQKNNKKQKQKVFLNKQIQRKVNLHKTKKAIQKLRRLL